MTDEQRRNLVNLVLRPLLAKVEAEAQKEKRDRLAAVFGPPATGEQ